MQVKEVMTRNPETASPGVPIREVAEKIQSLNVSIIPICEGPRVVGVVTDRDVTIRALPTAVTQTLLPSGRSCRLTWSAVMRTTTSRSALG